MKTWCDDAITGVKQERGGTQSKTEKKKKISSGSFSRLSITYNHRGFFGEGSHTPAHPPIKMR